MAANLQFLDVRERFLPVKQAALRDRILADPRLSACERELFAKLFEVVAARFHFEFRERLERLRTLYDPFDPDCDTLPLPAASEGHASKREELVLAFEQLLLDANFVKMPWREVTTCIEYQSQTGMVIESNLSDYAQLQVCYRGMRRESRSVRRWLAPWTRTTENVHVISRVALLVRLAKEPNGPVYLKFFKDVVAEDLEMLLPFVRIRMRLMDHLKIGSSMAGGMATATWKVFSATILSPWLFLLVMSGLTGAAIRGLFGFLSSKTKYMQALSSNLYFRNLANNSSVLAHLIDSAEAEECKELLLAYFILYVERGHDYTANQLDRRVEQWLRTEFDLNVDFEIADAVQKLEEKDLLVRHRAASTESSPTESVLKVYDLPSALRRLDAVWDAYHACPNEQLPEQDRVADATWPSYPDQSARTPS